MIDPKNEMENPLTVFYANTERFRMHQNGLFKWSLIGLALFLLSWNADTLTEMMGIHVFIQKDNPSHDLLYFLPVLLVLIISVTIALSTGGVTLLYWSKLTNKPKKIITICSAFGILLFATYTWLHIILE
jgi:hypothetical protein